MNGLCLIRASSCSVLPTYAEPIPGWVDNLNGPMGEFCKFCKKKKFRVIFFNQKFFIHQQNFNWDSKNSWNKMLFFYQKHSFFLRKKKLFLKHFYIIVFDNFFYVKLFLKHFSFFSTLIYFSCKTFFYVKFDSVLVENIYFLCQISTYLYLFSRRYDRCWQGRHSLNVGRRIESCGNSSR